jgi:hypothetical protein
LCGGGIRLLGVQHQQSGAVEYSFSTTWKCPVLSPLPVCPFILNDGARKE